MSSEATATDYLVSLRGTTYIVDLEGTQVDVYSTILSGLAVSNHVASALWTGTTLTAKAGNYFTKNEWALIEKTISEAQPGVDMATMQLSRDSGIYSR